jgi:hypothetical protein
MRRFTLNKEGKNLEPNLNQIKRFKNFSRIYSDYELLAKKRTRPLYKDPKLYLLFVIIGILILLLFFE